MAGLYVHIPFCAAKCRYCDFVSFPDGTQQMQAYIGALKAEMRLDANALPALQYDTVFIGGGTPSILPGGAIEGILSEARGCFTIAEGAEITIEANPGTLDPHKLNEYRRAGVNRLSLGLQSANDCLLAQLGRIHRLADFLKSFELARQAGFVNINADIMYGVPEQTVKDHLSAIELLGSLGVEHISAYALIVEEGTPLYTDVMGGAVSLPDEDAAFAMHAQGIARLGELGYRRYEISNYAKPGRESRHNLNYWDNGEYLGLGLAAHSAMRINGCWRRFSNTESLDAYVDLCRAGKRPVASLTAIPKREEMFECVMLGLRKVAGVRQNDFMARFGVRLDEAYIGALDALKRLGWLEADGESVRLTHKGLDMQNAALLYFMDG